MLNDHGRLASPPYGPATDPRVIFLFVLLLSSGSVILRDALALTPVLLAAMVAAIWARAPVGTLLRRLGGLWAMLAAAALLQGFASGSLMTGLLTGAAVLQRMAVLMLSGAMLAAYPGHTLVQAMLQLRLPYQLAYMLSIGLRFLPQFRESFRDSLTAMQLRGVEFRHMKPRTRFKIYTYLLMPTIAAGVHSARALAMAMELRGFGAHDTRGVYAPLRMRGRDWLACSAVLLWGAALTGGEIVWRVYA